MSARRTSRTAVASGTCYNRSFSQSQHPLAAACDSSAVGPQVLSMPRSLSSQGSEESDASSLPWQDVMVKQLETLKDHHEGMFRELEQCIDKGELLAEWCEAKQVAGTLAKDMKITTAKGYVKSKRSWNSWMEPERNQAPLDAFVTYLSALQQWLQDELPVLNACGTCGSAGVEAALASEHESEEIMSPTSDRSAPVKVVVCTTIGGFDEAKTHRFQR